ncbi:4Fe-4S dicluster domain-containing protein [Streptomyces sp. NPDC094438]|uniref:4Fe-4S dicluster domain-containing protein n=1 Tax=Streptomyces sp. NPDC094438 TaxID=3366061 RepID=UPI00381CF7B0
MTVTGATAVLDRQGLEALVASGRTVVGPIARDGAIVLAELDSAEQLPYGWGVELEAGRYRLRRREDGAAFAHSAGPQSWKNFLHPQREKLWSADRSAEGEMTVRVERPGPPSYAFLGVRPCDLRAISIQDRVLAGGSFDDGYEERRRGAFLIAVECTESGATCVCVSMGAGPGADSVFDLALTEVVDDAGHRFYVPVGSEKGTTLLDSLPHREPDAATANAARAAVAGAVDKMGRAMPPVDLPAQMGASLTAERWDDVASRCLTCGNCTMVCPTCFCTTTEEVTDLTGELGTRHDQFGSSTVRGDQGRSGDRGRADDRARRHGARRRHDRPCRPDEGPAQGQTAARRRPARRP